MSESLEWWQSGVIYQIYPRSFHDHDGDGIGDLKGIRSKLDYLQWLGVDAIWISPVFPSPMADFGYDVSNYIDIDPLFGDVSDFDDLLADAHGRGIRVILDFVPNHTSDQHAWFQESRSSPDNPKRDWYLWRDPSSTGGPPNNWLSSFGGNAWTWDEVAGQYYHHHFLPEQPDLNWRNPAVVDAMLDAMRFWLERGVDGFRMDVIWLIIKDEQYRDNPSNPSFEPHEPPHHQLLATYTTDRPEVHDIIAKMRELLDSYDQRMMVGEIYLPIEKLMTYYGAHGTGVHLPFNFQLINMQWNAREIEKAIENYEAALPQYGWPNWVLGNHDQPRSASRIGAAQARVAAVLLLTLRGTPTMYYGDEIGMPNVPIPPESVHDPVEKRVPGIGMGRDPQRTPMQWSAQPYAGFSSSGSWLPIASDFESRNVEVQKGDSASMLSLYRRLIELRRKNDALSIGDYSPLPADGNLLAYVRRHSDRRFVVILNLGGDAEQFSSALTINGKIVVSTHSEREGDAIAFPIKLLGNEAIVIECDAD